MCDFKWHAWRGVHGPNPAAEAHVYPRVQEHRASLALIPSSLAEEQALAN